ncbi:MAG TPA: enoyl-CoA hydratase/isomerase family protein [Dehalococcoidia bacterium]|nr:enoyl-CoA hydratase/isomerase family protein [Dehalococcoidia bacterium]
MEYETLIVQRGGPVMTVRLNRPDKRNAINRQMHLDLQALCRELADDFGTRVVVLAGEGKAFSAGADTSEWGQPGPANDLAMRHISGIGSRTATAIESLDQITIAAVHGFAVGGAVVLACACDLRVAGESAWFSIPEVELGIPLSWHALPRLAREVGPARALELTVLCDRFSAQQAYEYGLVTHLAPDGQELATARDLADRIVAKPALPVAMTKGMMKAIKRRADLGEVAYSDPDMLLYSRLMQQRARRLEQEGRGV